MILHTFGVQLMIFTLAGRLQVCLREQIDRSAPNTRLPLSPQQEVRIGLHSFELVGSRGRDAGFRVVSSLRVAACVEGLGSLGRGLWEPDG